VINDPNLAGVACNYDKYGFYLGGQQSRGGLPNFIASYFNIPVFDVVDPCLGDTTSFVLSDTADLDSVYWDFGDPSSGPLNNSRDLFPKHYYANIGIYPVNVVVYIGSVTDTIQRIINVTFQPTATLRSDTVLCEGNVLTLDPGSNPGADFLWSTGQTSPTIQVDTSGLYLVDINYGNICFAKDSVQITFTPAPIQNFGPDTTLCNGGWLLLDAGNPGSQYTWSTGDTTQWITVLGSGTYTVDVSYLGCPISDTIDVMFENVPVVDLGPDTSFCLGLTYTLDAGTATDYLWSTGAVTQTIDVTTTGTYIVTASNGACETMDTVVVSFDPAPVVALGPDQTVCDGQTVTLDAENPGANYVWSTGEVTQTIDVFWPAVYSVTVEQNGCVGVDTFELLNFPQSIVTLGDEEEICHYDYATLTASSGLNTYAWSTGQTGRIIQVNNQATFWVTGVDNNGCQADTAYQNILVEDCSCTPDKNLYVPNAFTPTQLANTRFFPRGNTNMFINEMKIFNRWGELVYQAGPFDVNDPTFGWDGMYKGEMLKPQTFAYYIIAQCGGETYPISGNVTLIR
jgi:gliding motility-associated-like protein